MFADEEPLHPARRIFDLGQPSPNVELETLRRAVVRIGDYFEEARDDRERLRTIVSNARQTIADQNATIAQLQAAGQNLAQRLTKAESDIAALKLKLPLI